jgi:hypothetical protein
MLRWLLIVIHAFLATTCLAGAASAQSPGDAGPAWFLTALFAGVATGLLFKTRWTVLPAAILALITVCLAGIFALAVLWPENEVARLLVGCLLILTLETVTAIHAWRSFGKKAPPAP